MDGFYNSAQLSQHELHQLQIQHQHQRQQLQQQQEGQRQQQQDRHARRAQQAQAQAQAQAHANSISLNSPTDGQHNMSGMDMMANSGYDNPAHGDSDDMQQRRKTMPPNFHSHSSMGMDPSNRRMSSMEDGGMMDFTGGNSDLANFQFGQNIPAGFPTLDTSNLSMSGDMSSYLSDPNALAPGSPDMIGTMISPNLVNLNMGQTGVDNSPMNIFPSSGGHGSMGGLDANQMPPMPSDFAMDLTPDSSKFGGEGNSNSGISGLGSPDGMRGAGQQFDSGNAPPSNNQQQNMLSVDTLTQNFGNRMPPSLSQQDSSSTSVISPAQANSSNNMTQPSTTSDATTPATSCIPRETKEKTIYSKSGFDMLKALWLVATRKDPRIHLGAVDMSCAFVVCDMAMNDCPIIYVSDNFQNLTGYSRHEIVGQNCRFLQSPDGKVEAGSKREFVDDGAVYNLKNMIHESREVQQSLINYRKGGKPFLNLLTMIPIPWDTDEIRYFIGFQIDLVECPDAISSGQEIGGVKVNYKHSDIGQYIWTPPNSGQWEPENGQTLGMDDVSTLLQQFSPQGAVSDWHKQSWDKMLLENTDDVVHVLSLKGLFLYLSPSCRRVLEYDSTEMVGQSLSSVCHPSDIVPVTRELKDATANSLVNIVFRIRRKNSGYTWFESHGSLFVEQGKGRKCIILIGRKRPVYALSRRSLEANGGIGDSELWTKLSTSGMFLYVSSSIRSLLDMQPETLVGTSIQDLMRKESRPEFGRALEKARRGKTVSCKHEIQNRRGQVLQAQTTLYPGDAADGQKPSFVLAQTKLLKASTKTPGGSSGGGSGKPGGGADTQPQHRGSGHISQPAGGGLPHGNQDAQLAADDNIFEELRTTKCSSWQFELRQMEKINRILAEELGGLLSNKKKRKRRKGVGNVVRDCANCHTKNTPEWRRGPSGNRDLCNSCGLRWAKQTGRVSPRNSSRGGGDSSSRKSASPGHSSPLHKEMSTDSPSTVIAAGTDNAAAEAGVGAAAVDPSLFNSQGVAAVDGSASATGEKPDTTVPPFCQSSLIGGPSRAGMASIREERETSQP